MVLVSVFMTSYNHERYISEAIESVLNQTFPDLELIIVDDCSNDNSREIIQRYQAKDKRVRTLFHAENQGIARTANDAFVMAKGKFVSFIGSDDLWVPTKLERQLEILKNNDEAIIWSEGDIIDSNGVSVGKNFTDLNAGKNKPRNGRIFREIINENYIFGQSLLFKRDFCSNLRFNTNLRYLNDYQFMVDLAYAHDFLFIPESLAKYRIHGKNTICRDQKSWLIDRVLLRNYFLQRYGNSLPRHLRGSLLLKIGEAYMGLGCTEIAKWYYLKALQIDLFSKESLLYLAYTAGAKSVLHKFLLEFYFKLSA